MFKTCFPVVLGLTISSVHANENVLSMPTTERSPEKIFLSLGTTVGIGNNDLSKMDHVYDFRIGELNTNDKLGWSGSLTYGSTRESNHLAGKYYSLSGGLNYQLGNKYYLLGEIGYGKTSGNTGMFNIDDGRSVLLNTGIFYQSKIGINASLVYRHHTKGEIFQNASGVIMSMGYTY